MRTCLVSFTSEFARDFLHCIRPEIEFAKTPENLAEAPSSDLPVRTFRRDCSRNSLCIIHGACKPGTRSLRKSACSTERQAPVRVTSCANISQNSPRKFLFDSSSITHALWRALGEVTHRKSKKSFWNDREARGLQMKNVNSSHKASQCINSWLSWKEQNARNIARTRGKR